MQLFVFVLLTPPLRGSGLHLHLHCHWCRCRGRNRDAVDPVVFNNVVLLKPEVIRVLRRIKRRHVDVFVLKMVVQVSDGCVRIGARAVHGCRRLLLVNHFDEPVHELQDGTVPAGEKVAAINEESRINDALVETIVLAAPRPEIGVPTRAFKIPRLNRNNAAQRERVSEKVFHHPGTRFII